MVRESNLCTAGLGRSGLLSRTLVSGSQPRTPRSRVSSPGDVAVYRRPLVPESRVLERVPYTHNSFVEQGFGTRLSNARLTIRMRGEVDAKGAQLLLLAQAETDKTTANMVLSGQPFKVTKDWSEQTVTLVPDPEQWTCLGSRHDSTHKYGCDDIARVLEDVNVDIIFVWFPLDVVPRSGDLPDMHIPRAGQDYPVDRDRLPKGLIMFDYVKLQFSE